MGLQTFVALLLQILGRYVHPLPLPFLALLLFFSQFVLPLFLVLPLLSFLLLGLVVFHRIILLLAVIEVGAGVGVVGVIVAMGGIGASCLCLLHRPPLLGGGGGDRGGRRRAKGVDSGTGGGRRTVPVDLPN